MKTQAEIDAANQYAAYQQGWAAGASVRAMDPKAAEHANKLIRDAYNKGYGDGRKARNDALHAAAETYGHTINFLRLQGEEQI